MSADGIGKGLGRQGVMVKDDAAKTFLKQLGTGDLIIGGPVLKVALIRDYDGGGCVAH